MPKYQGYELEEISQQFVKQIENSQSIQCLACNHYCKIQPNNHGRCGIRYNYDQKLYLIVQNRPISVAIDPIEKKPLYHFYPGQKILSLGTIGCNFCCQFCQNWEISQVNPDIEDQNRNYYLTPKEVINACLKKKLHLIAFTYNEPTTWIEYNLEICREAQKHNIQTVYVSNGFMSKEAAQELKKYISAINIDLKAFKNETYKKLGGNLNSVCENIKFFYENGIETEVTTLVVPGLNDSDEEITQIAQFLVSVSSEIPWHISAFHPDYKMLNVERTPTQTLERCYEIGTSVGLKYIYIGNVWNVDNSTKCFKCGEVLIDRTYSNKVVGIDKETGRCKKCQEKIYGVFN